MPKSGARGIIGGKAGLGGDDFGRCAAETGDGNGEGRPDGIAGGINGFGGGAGLFGLIAKADHAAIFANQSIKQMIRGIEMGKFGQRF